MSFLYGFSTSQRVRIPTNVCLYWNDNCSAPCSPSHIPVLLTCLNETPSNILSFEISATNKGLRRQCEGYAGKHLEYLRVGASPKRDTSILHVGREQQPETKMMRTQMSFLVQDKDELGTIILERNAS